MKQVKLRIVNEGAGNVLDMTSMEHLEDALASLGGAITPPKNTNDAEDREGRREEDDRDEEHG